MAEPTSTKPYLLRAVYEWCVDNGLTPYISVRVDSSTRVPMEHVQNGEIVLNIGPLAANRLKMGNEAIECTVRFSGVAKELFIPVNAVTSIYARETGHGMTFELESKSDTVQRQGSDTDSPTTPSKSSRKPTLKRIK